MRKNVGMTDRYIRVALFVIFIILAITVSWIFWILAAIAIVTAIFGVCPLYKLFNFSTKKSGQN